MKNKAGRITQLYKQYVFSCTYNQLSIVKFKDDSKKKTSVKKNIAGLIYKTMFHQFLP